MKNNKKVYPTEKETLQTLFALVFGANREQIGLASSRARSSIFWYGSLTAILVAALAALILVTA